MENEGIGLSFSSEIEEIIEQKIDVLFIKSKNRFLC